MPCKQSIFIFGKVGDSPIRLVHKTEYFNENLQGMLFLQQQLCCLLLSILILMVVMSSVLVHVPTNLGSCLAVLLSKIYYEIGAVC